VGLIHSSKPNTWSLGKRKRYFNKEGVMKSLRGYEYFLKTALFLLVVGFPSLSFGDSEDETLFKQAKQIFSPLPQVMVSEKNSITSEKVKLGKILFYESRISVDGTVSCIRCHPISLYGADGLRKSIGNNCKVNPRNAPTLFNAAAQISAHWIGNRTDVEDQAKQSVMGPPSFGLPSFEALETKLKEIKGYNDLFKKAFPKEDHPITVENFAKAVGAFERTLVTPSPFDAFIKGDKGSLKEKEKRGLRRFVETGCTACHSGQYLGGQMYQKFGIVEPYWKYTKSETIDEGRYVVTKNESDKYLFKVPVLRNVAKTAPYFHDGSVDKLEDAVWIMGKIQFGRDLNKPQVEDIIAFLNSLTGKISEEALKAPLLPSSE
jgi:cytochrome c peroxidase